MKPVGIVLAVLAALVILVRWSEIESVGPFKFGGGQDSNAAPPVQYVVVPQSNPVLVSNPSAAQFQQMM